MKLWKETEAWKQMKWWQKAISHTIVVGGISLSAFLLAKGVEGLIFAYGLLRLQNIGLAERLLLLAMTIIVAKTVASYKNHRLGPLVLAMLETSIAVLATWKALTIELTPDRMFNVVLVFGAILFMANGMGNVSSEWGKMRGARTA